MRWTEARSWDRASLEASARTAARSTSVAGLIVFAPTGAPVPPVPAVSNGVESRGEAVSPLDEPVSAAAFAYFWLGTEFVFLDFAGFALIISCIFLLAKDRKKA